MRTVRARNVGARQAPSVKPYGRAAAHRGGIWWSPTLLCAAAVLLVPGTNSSARTAAIRSVSAAAIPPGTGTGSSYCASVVTGGYELGGGSTSFDNVYPCGPNREPRSQATGMYSSRVVASSAQSWPTVSCSTPGGSSQSSASRSTELTTHRPSTRFTRR